MKRNIRKVAVLGAGVMGAQIAAHLVNSNVDVVLFDLPAKQGDKSSTVELALKKLTKLKPAPFATKDLAQQIKVANYDEDLKELRDCDLIIEAIAEKMQWKKTLYDTIEPYVAAHTILASNTSGLSINELSSVLNEKLRDRFLGVHFFNPPRYMHLVELIPCQETLPEVIESIEPFFISTLGKGVVIAKDTPNFIGNRVGVFSMLATMIHARKLKIPFEVVDQITGKPLGRPKSGTFRTADVVGLDTMAHVINTLKTNLPNDPWAEFYQTPDYIQNMIEAGALGQKTRKGIYINKGKQVFSPEHGDYVDAKNQFDEGVAKILKEKDWAKKIDSLRASEHPHAQFIWVTLRDLFHYCLITLKEIAHCARDVDFAIRWGFGWQIGPFEIMQLIGLKKVISLLNQELENKQLLANEPLPSWVNTIDDIHNTQGSYSAVDATYIPLPSNPVYQRQIVRENVIGSITTKPAGETIFENNSVCMWHQGDDIAILSFKTKMHTIGSEVLESIIQACELAENDYAGLVLWHQDAPFSVGANLKEAAEFHAAGNFEQLERMVKNFQNASMALKHCFVPTAAAVQGMALGGACEFQMHTNITVAAQESYLGLVEAGVGLIPAGAGLKEFAQRAVCQAKGGDLMPHISRAFEATAMAKTSISARDAQQLGLLSKQDIVIANSHELLYVAKAQVRALAETGFRPPSRNELVKVVGKPGKATLMLMAVNLLEGHFISEHDYDIADRIASTLTGGEVEQGSRVTQDWLLKLERDNFLNLLQNPKTQQRIAHTLTTGKPLRN